MRKINEELRTIDRKVKINEEFTSYVMLPPEVAGWRRDALEIEPLAERIHISRLLCCMNTIILWETSC